MGEATGEGEAAGGEVVLVKAEGGEELLGGVFAERQLGGEAVGVWLPVRIVVGQMLQGVGGAVDDCEDVALIVGDEGVDGAEGVDEALRQGGAQEPTILKLIGAEEVAAQVGEAVAAAVDLGELVAGGGVDEGHGVGRGGDDAPGAVDGVVLYLIEPTHGVGGEVAVGIVVEASVCGRAGLRGSSRGFGEQLRLSHGTRRPGRTRERSFH